MVQAVASRRALRACFTYMFNLVCYKCPAFVGLCFHPASIFAIGSLVASPPFWFCLSVLFCSGVSWLPPLMLDWRVGVVGLSIFFWYRRSFLSKRLTLSVGEMDISP